MIAAAVRPGGRDFPLCKEAAATHASGVCAAAIATRDFLVSLRQLCNLVRTQYGEIVLEIVFTPRRLEHHLQKMARLHQKIPALLNTLSAQCFRELPGGKEVCDDLLSISDLLVQRVIMPIRSLHRQIPVTVDRDAPTTHWSDRIKAIIAEARRILWQLVKRDGQLSKAETRAKRILARLEEDWRLDVGTIRAKGACRAASRPCPSMPKNVEVFLARAERNT